MKLPSGSSGGGGVDYSVLQGVFHEMSICMMNGSDNRGNSSYTTMHNSNISISGQTSGTFNAPYGTAKSCTISCSKKGYYYAYGMAMGRGYSGSATYVRLTVDGTQKAQSTQWGGIYYANSSIQVYEYAYIKSNASGTFTPLGIGSGLIYLGETLDNYP